MKKLRNLILKTADDHRSLMPRLVVGLVFLSEGIQKFLFPESVGAGRFEKIGFANPEALASLVAIFEIISGLMMLAGFIVRLASVPILIIMTTAIITTKIPILMEEGFWQMAHDARTDFAMTMLLIFILIYGAGRLSVDYLLFYRLERKSRDR
jgi:uncharacterized membrane protein YphA (DoxX/SURF4 family)